MAGDAAECVEVPLARRPNNVRRQRWRRRLAVPSARAPLQVEIVAQRLLVEARLHATQLIVLNGPEAQTVGSQDFVDQRDAALTVASELELNIRNDDSAP